MSDRPLTRCRVSEYHREPGIFLQRKISGGRDSSPGRRTFSIGVELGLAILFLRCGVEEQNAHANLVASVGHMK